MNLEVVKRQNFILIKEREEKKELISIIFFRYLTIFTRESKFVFKAYTGNVNGYLVTWDGIPGFQSFSTVNHTSLINL